MRLTNRLWNYYGAIGILVLSVTNIFLTIRLFHLAQSPTIPVNNCPAPGAALHKKPDTPTVTTTRPPQSVKHPPDCLDDSAESNFTAQRPEAVFGDLNLKLGRWDRTRTYKVFENVLVGKDFTLLSDRYSICIATQSSLERLGSLVQMALHWTGPISVGIFAIGDDDLHYTQIYLTYLLHCFPELVAQMAFHLVFARQFAPSSVLLDIKLDVNLPNYNCDTPDAVLSGLAQKRPLHTQGWRNSPYPQNHMRNVARKGCQTDYVFLIDVDIIPNFGMADQLNDFLRLQRNATTEKVAYVIPTFEVDHRALFPKSKADVLNLVQRKLARPFHQKIFIYNQFATNFSRWTTTNDSNLAAHISYNVTNFEFFYEPFYVARDSLNPPHDERFVGYGFTRNTQVYEMFVAGYQFQVLSPLFTCHPGLQNKRHQLLRDQQNNRNLRELEGFKREVFAKYHKDPLKMMVPKPKKGAKERGKLKTKT